MAEQTLNFLVEGGKATAGPPIGPALGPLGVNIGKIISDINKQTEAMKGITVPVKLVVDPATKEYKIFVGTPSTASLIKKELNLQKGSGKTKSEMIADAPIDVIIKIAKIKKEGLASSSMKTAVKEILGTCKSTGILVESKDPQEVQRDIDGGAHSDKIEGKVALREISASEIETRKKELAAVIEAKRAEEARLAEAAKAAEAAAKPAEEVKEAKAEGEAAAPVEAKAAVPAKEAKAPAEKAPKGKA